MSGVSYTVQLVERLIDQFGERIAGLKDSSGDLEYARIVAKLTAVFPGTEESLGEARAGVFAGCISATANLTSAFCQKAFHHGDEAALAAAVRIRKIMAVKPFVPGVKAVLSSIHVGPPWPKFCRRSCRLAMRKQPPCSQPMRQPALADPHVLSLQHPRRKKPLPRLRGLCFAGQSVEFQLKDLIKTRG